MLIYISIKNQYIYIISKYIIHMTPITHKDIENFKIEYKKELKKIIKDLKDNKRFKRYENKCDKTKNLYWPTITTKCNVNWIFEIKKLTR